MDGAWDRVLGVIIMLAVTGVLVAVVMSYYFGALDLLDYLDRKREHHKKDE